MHAMEDFDGLEKLKTGKKKKKKRDNVMSARLLFFSEKRSENITTIKYRFLKFSFLLLTVPFFSHTMTF